MTRNQPDRSQRALLEESTDLHRDAMRQTNVVLDELVERHDDQHSVDPDEAADHAAALRASITERDEATSSSSMLASAGVAGAMAAGLVALSASAASAGTPTDIQILQTQASLENLAVATYGVALTLPFLGGSSAIPVVKAFVTQTKTQHLEHAQTFNAALRRLKGKPQNNPDPVLLKVVNAAKPKLTTPSAVVALALELENGAAATYVKYVATLKDPASKSLTASIMGVEAQHVAILLAVQALIGAGDASMITLPPPLASLPSVAGSVGFPQPFFSIAQARPATEGAVN